MSDLWTAELVDIDADSVTRLRQKNHHRPEDGLIGDCYRTAIACLLGAPTPTYVPHFVEQTMHVEVDPGWEQRKLARAWLREMGLDMMTVTLDFAQEAGRPYVVTVQSRRGAYHHAVVGCGSDILHDPSGADCYTADDIVDEAAEMLCLPYDPDPDEMVRVWTEASLR